MKGNKKEMAQRGEGLQEAAGLIVKFAERNPVADPVWVGGVSEALKALGRVYKGEDREVV